MSKDFNWNQFIARQAEGVLYLEVHMHIIWGEQPT
jgi:hypothetical protein